MSDGISFLGTLSGLIPGYTLGSCSALPFKKKKRKKKKGHVREYEKA